MIDETSPTGSWRAALGPDLTCALCKQRVCDHSDAEWSGEQTHPALCEAEAMQFDSPDPYHDRQARRAQAAHLADRLLVAGVLLGLVAIALLLSVPSLADFVASANLSLWQSTETPQGGTR